MNQTLGKFAYNINKYRKTKPCRSRKEILDHYFKKTLQTILAVNEKYCIIQIDKKDFSTIHRSSNVVIGAYTTSMARVLMHTDLMIIKNAGGKVFYLNCDSLFFMLKDEVPNPLPMGDCTGDYKNMYPGKIESFCALSPKHYSVLYRTETGKLVNECKMSGLSMHRMIDENLLDHSFMEKKALRLLKGKKCTIKSQQIRTKRLNNKVTYTKGLFEFQFELGRRRKMSAPFDTFSDTQPFGFRYN